MKFEAPEGFIYYNGNAKAKAIYAVDKLPSDWVLLDLSKFDIPDNINDGLQPEYWDSLQQNGNRQDYTYAFCNTSHKTLCPLYPIKTDNAMYMFMGCNSLENANSILVHLTSDKPNMMYACANCNNMTNAPIFNYRNVSIVKTYMSMYAACYKLQRAFVYWGDGTADPVTQRNACNNMFFKCWELKNIDFGDAATGSPLNLDLSYAKELTVESVQSLLNSLNVIPVGSAGKYEITLATETVDNLTINYPDILTGFINKGWTIKGETRENTVTESEG